jgi:nitrogen fixation NifU-like protein
MNQILNKFENSKESRASELYQRTILDHYKNPRHYGSLDSPQWQAKGHNPICGDIVDISAKAADNRLHVGFESQSCALCQASASIMCQALQGRSFEEGSSLVILYLNCILSKGNDPKISEEATLLLASQDFPARLKCVVLPWKTMLAAISNDDDVVTTEEQSK